MTEIIFYVKGLAHASNLYPIFQKFLHLDFSKQLAMLEEINSPWPLEARNNSLWPFKNLSADKIAMTQNQNSNN